MDNASASSSRGPVAPKSCRLHTRSLVTGCFQNPDRAEATKERQKFHVNHFIFSLLFFSLYAWTVWLNNFSCRCAFLKHLQNQIKKSEFYLSHASNEITRRSSFLYDFSRQQNKYFYSCSTFAFGNSNMKPLKMSKGTILIWHM